MSGTPLKKAVLALFNIYARAEDPINWWGVRETFEQVDINYYNIGHTGFYDRPGVVVASRGIGFWAAQNV
jgi:hypothetical protein